MGVPAIYEGIFIDAMKEKHNSIAIFDDDFILSKSFDHRFSKLIELIGEHWDVIYLEFSQWLWDGVNNDGADFYIPNENTNGSFGVIYHERVFEKIVQEIEVMEAPFDVEHYVKSLSEHQKKGPLLLIQTLS